MTARADAIPQSAVPNSIWEGLYDSFAQAGGDAAFESATWLDQIASASRTATAHSGSGYILSIVAAVLANRTGTAPLRVLDFGGGLGPTYFALMEHLGQTARIDFHVVENAAVCRRTREVLPSDSRLTFRETLPAADEHFDIVHAGSSIQYVDDWRGLLGRLRAFGSGAMIFADLPAGKIPATTATLQHYYGSRIPCWLFRLDEFCAAAARDGYVLTYQAPFRRPYFGRDIPPPMSALPAAYRLSDFQQLMFVRGARL